MVSPSEAAACTYNDADRLSGIARDLGKNGSLDVTATYTYDPLGQRTRSVVTSAGVTTTTEWVYEGLTLLRSASVCGTSTTTVEYVNDSSGRAHAAWVSVPATPTQVFVWIVTDARGDVLELLTSAGSPLAYRSYTAYGELSSAASQATGGLSAAAASQVQDAVRLRFAGYVYDAESGLYYCSQRSYDPVTCQWITKDPARADGEESAYQYCGGDPVGKVDPSGEWGENVHRWKTKHWMKEEGQSDKNAAIIGKADNAVDWNTPPVFHNEYHFNTNINTFGIGWDVVVTEDADVYFVEDHSEITFGPGASDSRKDIADAQMTLAIRLWRLKKYTAARKAIGAGMHGLQDTWAHGNVDPFGHALDKHGPDLSYSHLDAWNWRTERRYPTMKITKDYWRKFVKKR